MSNRILWIDTETGSLDNRTGALLSVSIILEVDDVTIITKTWFIKPFMDKLVSDDTLKINHITRKEIEEKHIPVELFFKELIELLEAHYNGYDDRWSMGGKNISFDVGFLQAYFIDYYKSIGQDGLKIYYRFIKNVFIDPTYLLPILEEALNIKLQNHKLSYIYETFFKKKFNAHSSEDDITATIKLYKLFKNLVLNGVKMKLESDREKRANASKRIN